MSRFIEWGKIGGADDACNVGPLLTKNPVAGGDTAMAISQFTSPEEWRGVVGFEGLYEVSNHGRVGSLTCRGHRRETPLVLKTMAHCGYQRVNMYRHDGGKFRSRRVHQLVLESFVGPAPAGHTHAAHIDGDRMNNRLSNLKWATPKENAFHKQLHGRAMRRSGHTQAKAMEDDIEAIRAMVKCGRFSKSFIASLFGLTASTIGDICAGRSWNDYPTCQWCGVVLPCAIHLAEAVESYSQLAMSQGAKANG
jgi:hypothetical protein